MGISNSQAFIINNTSNTYTVNTLSIGPSQQIIVWDTKSTPINQTALNNFALIKDFAGPIMDLITAGSVSFVQDSIILTRDQFFAVLQQMTAQYTQNKSLTSVMSSGIKLDALTDADGRINFTSTPIGFGWLTYFTGKGDNLNPTPPDTGRGTGSPFYLEIQDGYNYGEMTIQFLEPIHVHDGEVYWGPDEFGPKDFFSIGVDVPGTPVTAASGNGNCNLAPTGLGFNIIVPAPGNGAYNVDLSKARTVSPMMVPGTHPNGYWDVTEETGIVRPADVTGAGRYNMFDAQLPRFYFIKNVGMGNPDRSFSINVYKTNYIHPSWKMVMQVTRDASHGVGWVSGYLLAFRRNTA